MTSPPNTRESLPALSELGADLHRAFQIEEQATARRRHPGLRLGPKRLFVMVLASMTLLPTAGIATRPWWAPSPDLADPQRGVAFTPEMQLFRQDDPKLVISARETSRGMCVNAWSVSDQSGGCDAAVPSRYPLSVFVAGTAGSGQVFGITSTAVKQVRISAAGTTVLLATKTPDLDRAAKIGMRTDFRYYMWQAPGQLDPTQPIRVLGITADGHVAGEFPRPRRRG